MGDGMTSGPMGNGRKRSPDTPRSMTNSTRRCSQCATDWPDDKVNFAVCPCCLEPTSRARNGDPLDWDEAIALKNQFDFEHYYEDNHIPQLALTEEENALVAKVLAEAVPPPR